MFDIKTAQPLKSYIAINTSPDGTIKTGDIIWLGIDGTLYRREKMCGGYQTCWINAEDLTPEILSFEFEEYANS